MSGFFIGFLSAVLVIGFVIRRKVRRWRRGGGRAPMVQRVLDEIQATPEQRTEVFDAIEQLKAAGFTSRSQWHNIRQDVAEALRSEVAEPESIVESRRPAAEQLISAFNEAFERVHAALQPQQRLQLATIVASGPQHRRGRRC
ncbi:MAG: ABC-type transporter Mla subunit MlaD [Myxococcota bacterium]|jgi:ABC-type transporter Mla subunit MlaD